MDGRAGQDRIFHYLPFSFCASWIAVLTFMLRGSLVTLNMDLTKIPNDMPIVAPHYFLNVPQLLERMRRGVDEQVAKKGGVGLAIYSRAKAAWSRKGSARTTDALWLWVANALVFPTIRKKMVGGNLKALICGSAPLTPETQDYFTMLGIPVLQVYGLTETTGICTMDDPRNPVPGRVGPSIPGIEMKLGENDEIVVRGPNVFPGYWNRPQQTAEVLRDGWFHTGDQGEIGRDGHLEHRRTHQEPDRPRLRPQDRARNNRRRDCPPFAGRPASRGRGQWARIPFRRSLPVPLRANRHNPRSTCEFRSSRTTSRCGHFACDAGGLLDRQRDAHCQWQAETRSDLRAHEDTRSKTCIRVKASGLDLHPRKVHWALRNTKGKRYRGRRKDGIIALVSPSRALQRNRLSLR